MTRQRISARNDRHTDRRRRHRASAAFVHDESGAVTVFSLFVFMMILIAGGIGIDIMRFEMRRADLQNTLDSAVLAGAGTRGLEPKAIVEDYFDKSGLSNYLNPIKDEDVYTTLNATRVEATADMTMPTHLLKFSGVKSMTAVAASTAEKRIPKLEISLVLDVSGSMGSNSKLNNLKSAAKDFVTTILDNSTPGDTVISIIPFSWSVTPSQGMYDALAVDEKHTYSTCLRFKDKDFNHASLSSGASATSNGIPVDQMIYTAVYGGWQNLNSTWRSCYTDDYMRILPYSNNETALHTAIDALQARGNTSGSQGMKWGAALLDPTFRTKGVTGNLIDSGEMDASLTTVPADYDQSETLKVVVMMGDGQNTTSYFFDVSDPEYRGKHSDLYNVTYQEQQFDYGFTKYNKGYHYTDPYYEQYCKYGWFKCFYKATGDVESVYYLRDPDDGDYYNIDQDEWISGQEFKDLDQILPGYIGTEQLDWEEAWGMMSPDYYRDITGNSGPWNDYVGSERVDGSEKNTRMKNVCAATKNEGVVVYTIGFEISQGGTAERTLKDCASTGAHYYRADGININDAFGSIAGNVVQLRLTQ
ncbi:pilus assembly protein TadG-related protein [Roseovarius salinarum]|uniref:pilus assembly protein TadG-related protein n=1 Tax=Roseovarius salinarum TaxID=1981892 RepID=UPI000C322213|nr:pilus assembly protein TadG-related protein [Roseovarius salinarum]